MERQWWQNEVVYQIYPKSFCDSNQDGIGDINGIRSKLGYLARLGVTMLWICPIFRSPMDDNGYDISDYFDLAPEFGTMEELKALIQEAKDLQIKIILDLVINHTSDEHPWFQEALHDEQSPYHDYYIFKAAAHAPNNWRSVFGTSVWEKVEGREEYYFHSFGKKQPDLNWENPSLRAALYDMVNAWLAIGIAGFRVDAITFIKKDLSFESREPDGADGLVKCTKTCRNQPGIEVFLQELKQKTFARHCCMTVAEAPGVEPEQLASFIGEDGYFSMIFDFKHADLDVASGSEWFKRIPWTIKDLNDRLMSNQMAIQKVGWAANFIENHDQPRATTKYLLDQATNPDAVKMLGAMYFFLRGTPFIYQGQELGMVNFTRNNLSEFNDISSIDQYHRAVQEGCTPQQALGYINLRSRDHSRTPFPWNDEQYGGFSQHTPWLAMDDHVQEINAQKQLKDDHSVFAFYQKMIQIRQTSEVHDTLVYGKIEPVSTVEDVIAYRRYTEEESILCCFSFSAQPRSIHLRHSCKAIVLNNVEALCIQGSELILQPYQALLIIEEEHQ